VTWINPLRCLSWTSAEETLRRREFIAALPFAAAWPFVAQARQGAMPVVGFLQTASPDRYTTRLAAYRQGLKDAGFIEGQNVAIEYRWAEGHDDACRNLRLIWCGGALQ
jgi:hypothetical protein